MILHCLFFFLIFNQKNMKRQTILFSIILVFFFSCGKKDENKNQVSTDADTLSVEQSFDNLVFEAKINDTIDALMFFDTLNNQIKGKLYNKATKNEYFLSGNIDTIFNIYAYSKSLEEIFLIKGKIKNSDLNSHFSILRLNKSYNTDFKRINEDYEDEISIYKSENIENESLKNLLKFYCKTTENEKINLKANFSSQSYVSYDLVKNVLKTDTLEYQRFFNGYYFDNGDLIYVVTPIEKFFGDFTSAYKLRLDVFNKKGQLLDSLNIGKFNSTDCVDHKCIYTTSFEFNENTVKLNIRLLQSQEADEYGKMQDVVISKEPITYKIDENGKIKQEIEIITVTNAIELKNAIKPGAVIHLKAGEYRMWEEVDENGDNVGQVNEQTLNIDDIDNITLIGIDDEPAEILVNDPYSPVLSFSNCNSVTIKNLKFGHTVEKGTCSGSVLSFSDCENIFLDSLNLYGSGTYGIEAYSTTNLNCTNTLIHDCTYGIMTLVSVENAKFDNCVFEQNSKFDMIDLRFCKNIEISNTLIQDNEQGTEESYLFALNMSNNISLTNSTVKNNNLSKFANTDISTSNVKFENNSWE